MRVLVTGATGYIGGRLVPRLLGAGHAVSVLVRDAQRIRGRRWANDVQVHEADLVEGGPVLRAALEGAAAAFYLVHAMAAGEGFEARDRRAAHNFVAAAGDVSHVVYLGGLLPDGAPSGHLRSRAEVGAILRESLPVTEFRAGPIIGSGSASFEMVRYLTERLPAMVAPRWIRNEVQPVAVDDVLEYLVRALARDPLGIVEIGADRLSFAAMMHAYAEARGLRRLIVPVPVLAPRLAARWVGLVTPISNRIAVPLIEGIVRPVVADTTQAERQFPEITPTPYAAAVRRALEDTRRGAVETRWSGALGDGATYDVVDWEGVIREVRTIEVDAPPEDVFRVFTSLGGARGWLVWNWAWALRGLLDQLVGGPGLRRGRRHPQVLLPGEAVDFWRVEAVEPPRLLRLRAEMKLPGRAWLAWEAVPEGGGTRLVQTALFAPTGLLGALYWYGIYPVHALIFSQLVRAIGAAAGGNGGA